MTRKKKILLAVLIAAAAAAAIGLWLFFGRKEGSTKDVAYVQKVAVLIGEEISAGVPNRYAGVVESQETWKVNNDSEAEIREVFVEVGQEVSVGTPLFVYDEEKYNNDLTQAQIELERMNNEKESIARTIEQLEKEKKKADSAAQANYTIQIQEQELALKQKELDIRSQETKISRLQDSIAHATVTSEIDGIVRSIRNGTSGSDSQDSAFITIMKKGDLRIKGSVNELNIGMIYEGLDVLVRSRADASQTWRGTVSSIESEPSQNDQNSYYYYGSDSMTSSSSYPFYVELESSEGLMIGQHVYIEPAAEGVIREGLWLDEYLLQDVSDGQAFIWADNGKGILERRAVTLGGYDEERMQYEILDGLTKEDLVALPDDRLAEGMKTAVAGTAEGEGSLTEGEYPSDEKYLSEGEYQPEGEASPEKEEHT